MAWAALEQKWIRALTGRDREDALWEPPRMEVGTWWVSSGWRLRTGTNRSHSASGDQIARIGRPPFTPDTAGALRLGELPAVLAWVFEASGLDGPDGVASRRALARRLVLDAGDAAAADVSARLVLRYPRRFFGDDLDGVLDLAAAAEPRAPKLRELHWAAGLAVYPTTHLVARLQDPHPLVRRLCWHALLWNRHVATRGVAPGTYDEDPAEYDPLTGDSERGISLAPDPARPPFDPDADAPVRAAQLAAVHAWVVGPGR